ncbi:MAG TPA: hypothetical protein VNS81_05120 [Nocardioides sp.]|nr:hypothetical protein [Nocardioides sp.]
MSENTSEQDQQTGITDDALPDDLVPSDDNPLAEGLPDGETAEGLLTEGKHDENSSPDDQDQAPDAEE